MLTLAESQRRFRDAVVLNDADAATPLLVGGNMPERRLDIHRRHYEFSLVDALLTKFPATVWLAGSEFVTAAAQRFVHEHPPESLCIAEYGERFPEFMASRSLPERRGYFRQFAELEWHVGCVAIAVEKPPLPASTLAATERSEIGSLRLNLQPGVRYQRVEWPVDELLTAYLHDDGEMSRVLEATDLCLEIRGSRGEFGIRRIPAGTFTFRRALQEGATLIKLKN